MKNKRCYAPFDGTSEIVLRIEEYDDIFSDFDMRPYSNRALSVDFLDEIKRASRDKHDGGIHLALCVPVRRSGAKEKVIKERLAAHFRRHHHELTRERRQVIQKGALMVFLGIVFMLTATFTHYAGVETSLARSFFLVFLEPAAWFLLWEGMDQIVFHSKSLNTELDFYKKMANTHGHVCFKSC